MKNMISIAEDLYFHAIINSFTWMYYRAILKPKESFIGQFSMYTFNF